MSPAREPHGYFFSRAHFRKRVSKLLRLEDWWAFLLAVLVTRLLILSILGSYVGGVEFTGDVGMHMGMVRAPLLVLSGVTERYGQHPPLLGLLEGLFAYPFQLWLSDFYALRLTYIVFELLLAGLFHPMVDEFLPKRADAEARRWARWAFILLPMGWMTSTVMAQDEIIGAVFVMAAVFLVARGRARAALLFSSLGVLAAKIFLLLPLAGLLLLKVESDRWPMKRAEQRPSMQAGNSSSLLASGLRAVGLRAVGLRAVGLRSAHQAREALLLLRWGLITLAPIVLVYAWIIVQSSRQGQPPPLLSFTPNYYFGTNLWTFLWRWLGLPPETARAISSLLVLVACLVVLHRYRKQGLAGGIEPGKDVHEGKAVTHEDTGVQEATRLFCQLFLWMFALFYLVNPEYFILTSAPLLLVSRTRVQKILCACALTLPWVVNFFSGVARGMDTGLIAGARFKFINTYNVICPIHPAIFLDISLVAIILIVPILALSLAREPVSSPRDEGSDERMG